MHALIGTVVGALAVIGAVGCERSSPGAPMADQTLTGTRSAPVAAPEAERESTTTDPVPTPIAEPGVVPTFAETIPPDKQTCFHTPDAAATATAAQVNDPAAPRIVVDVPPAWTSAPGTGEPADVALTMTGPDGMTGQVTIAATTLDPVAAFEDYADGVMARSGVAVLNMWPAEFCGYSSQELFGNWSDQPGESTEFADRIAHIWTNTGDYLVAVHLQGRAEAPGFDAAKELLTADFSIVIP